MQDERIKILGIMIVAYKTKLYSNGSIQNHKPRLVVNKYSQQHGIDYSETFAQLRGSTQLGFDCTSCLIEVELFLTRCEVGISQCLPICPATSRVRT